jgi:two-component system, NarL family, nitrate/nitrite response regulator NarL
MESERCASGNACKPRLSESQMLQIEAATDLHDEAAVLAGSLSGALDGAAICHRTLVISDAHFCRDAVTLCLRQSGLVDVIGSTGGEGALSQVALLHPAVMVVDSTVAAGVTIARTALTLVPTMKIVVFALTSRDEDFLSWAEAGIAGYLGVNGSISDLANAINQAVRGEVICSPRLTGLLLDHLAGLSAARPVRSNIHMLTRREREILALLAEGLANKVIARRLQVAESTVKNHIHMILEKLEVDKRGAAAALYYRDVASKAAAGANSQALAA